MMMIVPLSLLRTEHSYSGIKLRQYIVHNAANKNL